jgi:hypothetical protein
MGRVSHVNEEGVDKWTEAHKLKAQAKGTDTMQGFTFAASST